MRTRLTVLFVLTYWLNSLGQTYYLNGDAEAMGNNCYSLTQAFEWESGTVWYADQIDLNEPFSLEFYMNFGNLDANGADGMVFVLQTNGTSAIGVGGDGIGFAGFTPSFGIEFDTWDNSAQSNNGDLSSDHVAFHKNGNVNHYSANNLAGPVQASGMSANIEDGEDHVVQITWNPASQVVELYFDCTLRLSDQNNLITNIFNEENLVYWGFTGATGGSFNVQTVCLSEFFINAENEFLICEGEEVEIAASGNPDGSFSWAPNTFIDDATAQNTTVFPVTTTEYCCTYTDLCGNQSEECIWIEVEHDPIIDAGDDIGFCAGESLLLNATSDTPDGVYLWTSTNGNILNGNTTLTPEVNEAGNYVLEATSPSGVCSSTDSVAVAEIPLPVINIDNAVFLCPDSTIILDAGENWDAVLWTGNNPTQAIEVDTPGNYALQVTENGCSSEEIITVTEVELPDISLGPDVTLCIGEEIVLSAEVEVLWNIGVTAEFITVAEEGNYSCVFEEEGCIVADSVAVYFENPPVVNISGSGEICEGEYATLVSNYFGTWSNGTMGNEITVNAGGTYSIFVEEGVCSVTTSAQVDMISLPKVELGIAANYCLGETITLSALEEQNEDYLWSTGSTDPQIEVMEAGIYAVEVSNDCGVTQDSISIEFSECNYGFYIPNAFTPDNDGINDVWQISYYNLTQVKLTIFNRWGDPVFTTEDLDIPWTGSSHDGDYFVPDGVYAYLLEFWTTTGDADSRIGHVTLIR